MPFRYKPKQGTTTRQSFTKEQLTNALEEIDNGISTRKTAIKYGIDRTTLRRYKNNRDKLLKFECKGSQYKESQIFTVYEEKCLVDYLLTCSKMNYGLTRKAAMQFAFEYAQANSKKMPGSWLENKTAGKDWFRGFLSRNPEISLRTPEATSLSRATSFNKKNVGDFFDNLKLVREMYNFEPQNIYNCDETGCTTVQECPKVPASKKARQVGQVTSADRGILVTACFAVNALGNVIPPFFIFPRVRYNDVFVAGGPEGSDGDAYPSGWMTANTFLKYMKHFAKYTHASKENPILLILDNHESHVSIDVIHFAKERGITMLTIPPHCSNRLQPLDIAIYSSFKTRYNIAMTNWMLTNPGKTITIYNIPGFVKDVMSQAFSQANIMSGFRNSGIHPFNPEIFSDEDFLCSSVTDRDKPVEQPNRDALKQSNGQVAKEQKELPEKQAAKLLEEQISEDNITGPNIAIQTLTETTTTEATETVSNASTSRVVNQEASKIITPEMIKPFPKAEPRKGTRRGRQPGKTKILTKTPEKDADQSEQLNKTPEKQKPKSKRQKLLKENRKTENVKKKVFQSSDTETDSDDVSYADSSDSPLENEPARDKNWYCFLCNSDEIMDMRLCNGCCRYVHEVCVGLTKEDREIFVCPDCKGG